MTTNVLVLCTHNSARSVLAEGMLNHLAAAYDRPVRAFSAGSAPSGRVNPFALAVLRSVGIDVNGFRSKSWDEFTGPGAPHMRIVVTVCDSAAQEACPYWPGTPLQTHWSYPDPSNASGGDEAKRAAFELTRQAIAYRVLQLVRLPLETMIDAELGRALRAIGRS